MTERSNSPGHETRDAPVRIPLYYMLVSALIILLGGIGIWGLLHSVWQPQPERSSSFAGQSRASGEPALQTDPAAELETLNRRMDKRLNSTGWIDREEGIVHMPIDRAMDLLNERGLPGTDPRSGKEKTQ